MAADPAGGGGPAVAMPFFLIDGLFTRGPFTAGRRQPDRRRLLFHYGWGTPAFVLTRMLQPGLLRAAATPRRRCGSALVSVAVNIVLGVAPVPR